MRDLKYLANNIYKYRIKNNMTHEQLSELVGVSTRIIYDYESGKKFPSIITLFELSKALNTTLDSLVSEWFVLKDNFWFRKVYTLKYFLTPKLIE